MKTRHLKSVLWFSLMFALLALALSGCGSGSEDEAATAAAKDREKALETSLAAACEGQPVPGAAAYEPAAGKRPLVVLKGKPGGIWGLDPNYAKRDWQPQAVQDAQLVACLHNEPTLVETCPYTLENGRSASIERYQYITSIWLYEARSGKLVAETSWEGTEPALCSTETRFEKDETVKKVYGVAVGGGQVSDWLQPYIELAAVPTPAATDTPAPPPTPSADELVAAAIDFYEQGNLDAALAELQQALKLEPDNADAHRNLGTVYGEQEEWEKAIAAYEKAIELAPDFGQAYADLAAAHLGLGNLAEAEAAAEKGIELAPDYAMAYNNLAVVHGAQGDVEGAVALLQQALEVDAECADAHYNLGYAYESLGQPADAIDAYQAAIQADPGYADAYENLGGVYARQGQLEQAIDWWAQTLDLDPGRARAYMNLGMAHSQLGQEEEAVAAFQRYLELAPADDPDRAQVEGWLAERAEPQAQEYRSATNGFGLRYPGGWVYTQGGNQVLFAANREDLEGGVPGLVFKVGFITGPLAGIAESAGVEEITDPVLALETFAASMEVELGPAETGTISGYPAALAPMSGSVQDVPYLGDLVIVLVDERAVVGMAFAPPDEWESLRPTFVDMVNSLFFFEP